LSNQNNTPSVTFSQIVAPFPQQNLKDLADDIRARVDIVDLVSETLSIKKTGNSYQAFCPFHANTKTESFVIFPKTNTWKCFGACDEGGDVIRFVMKRDGLEYKQAIVLLAARAGIVIWGDLGDSGQPFYIPPPKIAPKPISNKPKCDCGRELETSSQRRLNKCFHCQLASGYAITGYSDNALVSFSYVIKKKMPLNFLHAVKAKIVDLRGYKYLVYPVENEAGLIGYNTIDMNGNKKTAYPFERDSSHLFQCWIGNRDSDDITICEGLATACPHFQLDPNKTILICGGAAGLVKAAKLYGSRITLILADNDPSQAGILRAKEAAAICGADIWLCPLSNNRVKADFNDFYCDNGMEAYAKLYAEFKQGLSLAKKMAIEEAIRTNEQTTLAKRFAALVGATYIQVNTPDLRTVAKPTSGVVILLSPMMTWKSQGFLKAIVDDSESSLTIADLRSLVASLVKSLNVSPYCFQVFDFMRFLADADAKHIATCINSLKRYLAKRDVLLVDEFDSVNMSLSLSTLLTDEERQEIYEILKNHVANARLSVFASATKTLADLKAIKRIAGDKPLTIYENIWRPNDLTMISIDFARLTQEIDAHLKAGKTVFGISTSKREVKRWQRKYEKLGIKTLAVHGDDSQAMKILISGGYVDYQLVICSPTALKGVSAEIPHFDFVFNHFSVKNKISPLTCTQATRRIRPNKTIYVCVETANTFSEINKMSVEERLAQIKTETLAATMKAAGATLTAGPGLDLAIEQFANLAINDLTRMAVELTKTHGDLAINWADNFFEFAKGQGFKIIDETPILPMTPDEAEAIKESHAELGVFGKELKIEETDALLKLNLADFNIKMLRAKFEHTTTERLALKKADIEDLFGECTEETIFLFDKHGKDKAINNAILRCENFTALRQLADFCEVARGKKTLPSIENIYAKKELFEALLDDIKLTIDEHGNYDFSNVIDISKDTDFSNFMGIIEKYKLTLGLYRREGEPHKIAMSILKNWLGLTVASRQVTTGEISTQNEHENNNSFATNFAPEISPPKKSHKKMSEAEKEARRLAKEADKQTRTRIYSVVGLNPHIETAYKRKVETFNRKEPELAKKLAWVVSPLLIIRRDF